MAAPGPDPAPGKVKISPIVTLYGRVPTYNMNAVKRLSNLKPSQRAELSDWLVTALAPLKKLERDCIVNGHYENPRLLAAALRMPYGRALSVYDREGENRSRDSRFKSSSR